MDRFRSLSCLRPAWIGLALLCASLVGCGTGMGEVSGTVRYNGQPLPFGTIQLLGGDGIPRAGKIGPDGTFSVQAPVGQVKVIVSCVAEPRMARFDGPAAARAAPTDWSPWNSTFIPQRYADWDASGLTVQVKRGKTQDFELTSP
jgi:hypothetical protein